MQHPGVQEVLKGGGPESQGYYASLGLTFATTAEGAPRLQTRVYDMHAHHDVPVRSASTGLHATCAVQVVCA